jgi:hypothetical protein
MDQVAHLYKITNQLTGQYYVGKHNGWLQNGYWGSGTRLKYNQEKHGIENFNYEILCYGKPEYILELESRYVTQELLESDKKCLNLRSGGEGSFFISEDTRKKIGQKTTERQLGKKHKLSTKEKISQSLKGKPILDSVKQYNSIYFSKTIWINNGEKSLRILESEKSSYLQEGYKLGRLPFTDEAKSNMAKSLVGRKHSEETKIKIGLTRKLNKQKGITNG